MKRFSFFDYLAVLVCLCVIFRQAVHDSQLPRHYVTSINGHVVSDIVLTNPVFVHYECEARIGTNGTEIYMKPVTNVLWHRWSYPW